MVNGKDQNGGKIVQPFNGLARTKSEMSAPNPARCVEQGIFMVPPAKNAWAWEYHAGWHVPAFANATRGIGDDNAELFYHRTSFRRIFPDPRCRDLGCDDAGFQLI